MGDKVEGKAFFYRENGQWRVDITGPVWVIGEMKREIDNTNNWQQILVTAPSGDDTIISLKQSMPGAALGAITESHKDGKVFDTSDVLT